MNYCDFNCYEVYYDGDIGYYCTNCLPHDVSDDMTRPIFQDMELSAYPTCDVCGKEHDYMGLTNYGILNSSESKFRKLFGRVFVVVHRNVQYFCTYPMSLKYFSERRCINDGKIIRKETAMDFFREKLDCGNDMLSDEIFDLLLEKALDNIESED